MSQQLYAEAVSEATAAADKAAAEEYRREYQRPGADGGLPEPLGYRHATARARERAQSARRTEWPAAYEAACRKRGIPCDLDD